MKADEESQDPRQELNQGGFVDEPPGSYLAELNPGSLGVVWGAANLVLTVVVGALAWTIEIEKEWYPPARLIWLLLPPSAILLIVTTLWQLGNPYARKSPARILFALGASLACLGLWLLFRLGLEVLPSTSP